MNKRHALSAILLATVVLGAGCNPVAKQDVDQNPTPAPTSERPAAKQGFGKLPSLQAVSGQPGMEVSSNFSLGHSAGSITAVSNISPLVAPMPAASDAMVVTGGGTAVAIRAPYPPEGQAKVNYDIQASLPEWGAEGNVYRVQIPAINTSIARSVSTAIGVPTQVSSGIQEIQSASVSWRDASGLIWNADMPGRNLNWYKFVDYSKPQENRNNPSKIDAEAIKSVADNFLRNHGFPQFAGQGVLEEMPMIMPLLRGEAMPCAMEGAAPAVPAMSPEDAKLMIYPSPCGYPTQVTVYYPDMRDGMSTVDTGGWISRKANIQIDVSNNEVVGGNVMLQTNEDASSYPLISSEDAMKRLMAGGNNPIYGWYDGSGQKEVNVTISSVKLGWMWHDSRENNTMKTYFLPALIAEGTVNRGNNQPEPEVYRTVVPLVADSEFQINQGGPIMYLKGQVDPAMESVPTPPPAPSIVPKP